MRTLSFFLAVLLCSAPQAHAIQNLMSLCERALTVSQDQTILLAPNQIALQGRLATYWAPEMEHHLGWIITEEFVRKNVSPNVQDWVFFVAPGDFVYVYGPDGEIVASGYYGENYEMTTAKMHGMEFHIRSNVPYLFHDQTLTQPITGLKPLRESFTGNARAVVIKTLKPEEEAVLKKRFAPWFERYQANRTRDDRFVIVGRRRAFELAHFQTPMTGSAELAHTTQNMQMMDWESGELIPGDQIHVFKYALQTAGTQLELKQGDYLMLMDANGIVKSEGEIGGPAFPWYSEDEKVAQTIEDKFKGVTSAFVAKMQLRDLK